MYKKIINKKICLILLVFLMSFIAVGCSSDNKEDIDNSVTIDRNMEINPENIKNVLLENGFKVRDVYLDINNRYAIDLEEERVSSGYTIFDKGYDVISFLENNFEIENGYWISMFSGESFMGSFVIDRDDIEKDMSKDDVRAKAKDEKGLADF